MLKKKVKNAKLNILQPLPGKERADFQRAVTSYCFKGRTHQGFKSVKVFDCQS